MSFGLKRERTLAEWLEYQQKTHPQAIALGLDRVRSVAVRLELKRPGRQLIAVAGTNGKGSTVAFLEAIARAAGQRVGAYTSPHLRRYNERLRIDGIEVEDADWVAAFERIQAARGEIALTYFEWGTLAALAIMADAGLDLAVLEVGLGGRLDAVNVIDADVAIITSVALDHMELLGDDREAIGREKAGILRPKRWAVLSELDPPESVLQAAHNMGARLLRRGRDFKVELLAEGRWRYRDSKGVLDLPAPGLSAPCQPYNAAAAIAALRALGPLKPEAVAGGVAGAQLAGRLQRIAGAVEIVLDVAHNLQAVQMLQRGLQQRPPDGRTLALLAALADKDAEALVAPLLESIDGWYLAGLADAGARSQSAPQLAERLAATLAGRPVSTHADVVAALRAARQDAVNCDRLVIYGSFHTVGQALAELEVESIPGPASRA